MPPTRKKGAPASRASRRPAKAAAGPKKRTTRPARSSKAVARPARAARPAKAKAAARRGAREDLPRHVAIVMDGNGRWAKQRGLRRTAGHRAGEEAVARAVDAALDLGVRYLTLYAFSTENWRRPPSEVRFLLNDTERFVLKRREEFRSKGVRMRWIGRANKVPTRILERIEESERLTAENTRMTLTVAFNYGGRAEIVDAAQRIAERVRAGRLDPPQIDDTVFQRALYDPDMPDVDLFIRTSGEQRVSNYLLWQSAYAEMVFLPVLWPDFRAAHLRAAVEEYQKRKRRFGGV